MADERRSDHWAELASLLGAEHTPADEPSEEVPSQAEEEATYPGDETAARAWQAIRPVEQEVQEVVESAAETVVDETPPVAEPVVEPRHLATPTPKRAASDWFKLAEALGVAVPVEVPEPIASPSKELENTEVVESAWADDLPGEPPEVAYESVEGSADDVEVVDVLPDGGQAGPEMVESVDTESEEVQQEDRTGRRRRRKRRRRGRRPEGAEAGEMPMVEGYEIDVEAEPDDWSADVEREPDVASVAEEGEEEESPTRRRRRRRRKGSRRGRDEERRTDVEAEEADEHDDLVAPVSDADYDEHDDRGHDEHEDDEDDDVDRSFHHGIPTWEEAVGYVVAVNMESRAKNPGGGNRGRGGRSNRSGRDRNHDRNRG
jgi:hypothetical protein